MVIEACSEFTGMSETTLFQANTLYCLKLYASYILSHLISTFTVYKFWKFVRLTLALVSPVTASHMVMAFTKKRGVQGLFEFVKYTTL